MLNEWMNSLLCTRGVGSIQGFISRSQERAWTDPWSKVRLIWVHFQSQSLLSVWTYSYFLKSTSGWDVDWTEPCFMVCVPLHASPLFQSLVFTGHVFCRGRAALLNNWARNSQFVFAFVCWVKLVSRPLSSSRDFPRCPCDGTLVSTACESNESVPHLSYSFPTPLLIC